ADLAELLCKLQFLRLNPAHIHLLGMPNPVNLSEKFSQINEHWKPHIAGELNGQLIKLVKFQGAFVWHHHDNEDEMFFVVEGQFRMEFRDEASEPKGPNSSGRDSARLQAVPSPQPEADRVITIHE